MDLLSRIIVSVCNSDVTSSTASLSIYPRYIEQAKKEIHVAGDSVYSQYINDLEVLPYHVSGDKINDMLGLHVPATPGETLAGEITNMLPVLACAG